jgi:hypothetical protein
MIISDMNYQECVDESNALVGGIDLGGSLTDWNSSLTQLGTMSTSGSGGSMTATGATKLDISSFGLSFVVLGL